MATLNLCSARGAGGAHLTEPQLARALSAVDADVVALQEVDVQQPRSGLVHQARVAAAALGTAHSRFAPALIGTPGPLRSWIPSPAVALDGAEAADERPRFGVALFSRRPVRRWAVLALAAGRAALPMRVADPVSGRTRTLWIPDEPRVALAAVLDGVSVIGTHLSFWPGTAWGQLSRLRRWAATLPAPVLLVGDLNLPRAAATRAARGRALATAATFPGPAPRLQLDHVLALGGSGDITSDGGRARRLDVGDHRLLETSVHLPGTAVDRVTPPRRR